MPAIMTTRPNLDEHDFKTVRELYAHAQNWARHYETMIVSTNVLLISASSLFVGLALRDATGFTKVAALLCVPILMSLIGIVLTRTIFRLYAISIERLIRLENLLNCYDGTKMEEIDGAGPLLPPLLMALPVRVPTSARFFFMLHSILIVIYGTAVGLLR
jgi:hypothetical protein